MILKMKKEPETSFTDKEEFQRALTNQYETLNNLRREIKNEHRIKLLKIIMKRFYERNQEISRSWKEDWVIENDQFGRPHFGIESNWEEYSLSYYKFNTKKQMQFYSFIHWTQFKENTMLYFMRDV